jgi:hypothetical protein
MPPIPNVVQHDVTDAAAPSPLTTLGSSSVVEQSVEVSVHRIQFEQSASGIHLSVPVTTEQVLAKTAMTTLTAKGMTGHFMMLFQVKKITQVRRKMMMHKFIHQIVLKQPLRILKQSPGISKQFL